MLAVMEVIEVVAVVVVAAAAVVVVVVAAAAVVGTVGALMMMAMTMRMVMGTTVKARLTTLYIALLLASLHLHSATQMHPHQ
eukprot:gene10943-biopygen4084